MLKKIFIFALLVILIFVGIDVYFNQPPDADYPSGTSGKGFTSPIKLINDHQSILRDSNYEMQGKFARVGSERSFEFIANSSSRTAKYNSKTEYGDVSYSTYFEKGVLFYRKEDSTKIEFNYDRNSDMTDEYYSNPEHIFTNVIQPLLTEYNFEAVKTSKRNGHNHIHYRPGDDEDSVNGEILVREDGLISAVNISDVAIGDDPLGYPVTEFQYSIKIGNHRQVKPPDWHSKASERILISKVGPSEPITGDADCDDFESQAAAQRYHEEHGEDNLDGDNDGTACEHLP